MSLASGCAPDSVVFLTRPFYLTVLDGFPEFTGQWQAQAVLPHLQHAASNGFSQILLAPWRAFRRSLELQTLQTYLAH